MKLYIDWLIKRIFSRFSRIYINTKYMNIYFFYAKYFFLFSQCMYLFDGFLFLNIKLLEISERSIRSRFSESNVFIRKKKIKFVILQEKLCVPSLEKVCSFSSHYFIKFFYYYYYLRISQSDLAKPLIVRMDFQMLIFRVVSSLSSWSSQIVNCSIQSG